MPLLQSAPSLLGFGHTASNEARLMSEPQNVQKPIRSASSIANLIDFVRNPTQNVTQVVEKWYDGTTKEDQDQRQTLEDRKQLLYVKMRMVRIHRTTYVN